MLRFNPAAKIYRKAYRILLIAGFGVCLMTRLQSQELYIFTEPASNMPARSLGVRLNNDFYSMVHDGRYTYRLNPEVMWGLNKNIMLHLNGYASNMYEQGFKLEGGSVYMKYRFYSHDDVHSHFRMAAYGKVALVDNPAVLTVTHTHQVNDNGQITEHTENLVYLADEISLNGNQSGFLTGVIATQLLHKLALSGSFDYVNRWDNLNAKKSPYQSDHGLDYSLSAGYLLLPKVYKDFRQTNFNLYCEFLGSTSLDSHTWYLDVAPAVQFIFNSVSRLDLGYRTQIAGQMTRMSKSSFLVRYEYNFLNIFNKK